MPVLMLHTEESNPHGLELRRMAERIGLVPGSYRFSAQYLLPNGMIENWRVAGTMSAADLGSQAAAAEGFGLPIAESWRAAPRSWCRSPGDAAGGRAGRVAGRRGGPVGDRA